MRAPMTIIEAMEHPDIFGAHFQGVSTWRPWKAFLKALFALPMDIWELALYRECTGRTEPPTEQASEAWLPTGRRGGKSRILALIASYLSTFMEDHWKAHLAAGEIGTIVVIAADRKQARVIMGYLRAFFQDSAMLREYLDRPLDEIIELTNGLVIEVVTCSWRAVRGRTIIAVLGDETAFWADENGRNPASAVVSALEPAMATMPGAMMLMASSPYAKSGPLWDKTKRYWGKDGPILIWRAATWVMNPTLPRNGAFLTRKFEEDAVSAAAEFGAEFRSDVSAFISREVVEACVSTAVYERPRIRQVSYRAFVDPSGGQNDAMTLAIGHRETDRAVVDAVRERIPPFNPEQVVEEFCRVLHDFGITEVTGDRYGGEWPREQFRKRGICYRLADLTRSDLYLNFLPALNSGSVDLLDTPGDKLVNQIAALERRVARGGKESIDHPPMGHDDLANAVAGLMSLIGPQPRPALAVIGMASPSAAPSRLGGWQSSIASDDPKAAWDRWHRNHQARKDTHA